MDHAAGATCSPVEGTGAETDGLRFVVRTNEFPRIARELEPRVERLVAKAAHDIEAGAKRRAPVDTGHLKNSIRAAKVGPMHWVLMVAADYAVYVENGTRFMAAQPFIGPAIDETMPKFMAAMSRVVG